MIAVISDVHANHEALRAVMNELERPAPERIICLGDLVGYWPDPERCIDAVEKACCVTICGNHDFALVHGGGDLKPSAAPSIELHRRMIMPRSDGSEQD